MKYFLDTEFIEGFNKPLFGKRRHFIDLISIGIVCEDGRKFYAICSDYNYDDASEWVKENVIAPMYKETVHGDNRNRFTIKNFHKHFGFPAGYIGGMMLDFFHCWRDQLFYRAPKGIEVYGYYADYDWVLFCSLFGRMIDLPKGFPMYCRDLKQMFDNKVERMEKEVLVKEGSWFDWSNHFKTLVDYPKQSNEHNALADAKWNFELYKFINKPI